MYGAILGDIIGSPYERDMGDKTKDFPLFSPESRYTDDTVMSVAVAEALMDTAGQSDAQVHEAMVRSMQKWGRRYPDSRFGRTFKAWLFSDDPKPYGSFGNGSAMRVSAAGWLYDDIAEVRRAARLSAEVSHNAPEGIAGAEAVASAVHLARTGSDKPAIRAYIARAFDYDLDRTCDEMRPTYCHKVRCSESVPESIIAFLDSEGFEDAIRNAVSLGGDTDTLGSIAGAIAEAFYGVPDDLRAQCRARIPLDMLPVIDRFDAVRKPART